MAEGVSLRIRLARRTAFSQSNVEGARKREGTQNSKQAPNSELMSPGSIGSTLRIQMKTLEIYCVDPYAPDIPQAVTKYSQGRRAGVSLE